MNKINLSKPVQTRDGQKVRIICTDRPDDVYPVVAMVGEPNLTDVNIFTKDGFYNHTMIKGNQSLDLINIPQPKKKKKVIGFVNVYYHYNRKEFYFAENIEETKNEAFRGRTLNSSTFNYIDTIKIKVKAAKLK